MVKSEIEKDLKYNFKSYGCVEEGLPYLSLFFPEKCLCRLAAKT
jgi:hypothetical protein